MKPDERKENIRNPKIDFETFIYKNYKKNELLNMIVDLEIRLETMDAAGADNTENQESRQNNEMLRTMRMTIVGGYL